MTAERSELQILGLRDLEITNFRSLDIRAICLICVKLTYVSNAIVLDDFFALQTETTFVDKKSS